jgi:DnaJ-class molecular chaperone
MKKVDYYESLGLKKTASHDEIKQAYRKLALVTPDLRRNIIPTRTKIRNGPR